MTLHYISVYYRNQNTTDDLGWACSLFFRDVKFIINFSLKGRNNLKGTGMHLNKMHGALEETGYEGVAWIYLIEINVELL